MKAELRFELKGKTLSTILVHVMTKRDVEWSLYGLEAEGIPDGTTFINRGGGHFKLDWCRAIEKNLQVVLPTPVPPPPHPSTMSSTSKTGGSSAQRRAAT